jgi:hypothetical protein
VASDGMDFDLLGFRVAISGSTVLGGAENARCMEMWQSVRPTSSSLAMVLGDRLRGWLPAMELSPRYSDVVRRSMEIVSLLVQAARQRRWGRVRVRPTHTSSTGDDT